LKTNASDDLVLRYVFQFSKHWHFPNFVVEKNGGNPHQSPQLSLTPGLPGGRPARHYGIQRASHSSLSFKAFVR